MLSTTTISADVFWRNLKSAGMVLTDEYSADGKSRFCKRKDGEMMTVSVHDEYPDYMVNKVLTEAGFFDLPLYNSGLLQ